MEEIIKQQKRPVVLISGVRHKVPIYFLTGYLPVARHFLTRGTAKSTEKEKRHRWRDWQRDGQKVENFKMRVKYLHKLEKLARTPNTGDKG